MPFANTDDDQEIYYEVHGTSGPLLVCISGYFGISDLWKPLILPIGFQISLSHPRLPWLRPFLETRSTRALQRPQTQRGRSNSP